MLKEIKTVGDAARLKEIFKDGEILSWVTESKVGKHTEIHFANQSGDGTKVSFKDLKTPEMITEISNFISSKDKLISPDGTALCRALKLELKLDEYPKNIFCTILISKLCERAAPVFQPETFYSEFKKLRDELIAKDLTKAWLIEWQAMPALCEMNDTGITLDSKAHKILAAETHNQVTKSGEILKDILEPFCQSTEFGEVQLNLDSPKELLEALRKMKCMVQLTNGNTRLINSTNKDEVGLIVGNENLKEALAVYREYAHIQNNFGESFVKFVNSRGKIYSTFNQIGAPTGRTSTEKPNLSGVPEKVRSMFIGGGNMKVISADYNQCELRILAHFSDDPVLVKGFQLDQDIHSYTAVEIFGDKAKRDEKYRKAAKAINFGIAYGLGIDGLAIQLRCSFAEASDLIFKHKHKFKKAHDYLNWMGQKALNEKVARSASWRMRSFEGPPNQDEGYVRRAGANMGIQGTAADIMKAALYLIISNRKTYNTKFSLWNTTYDEVSALALPDDVPRASKAIEDAMLRAMQGFIMKIKPKVTVKVADHWSK